VTTVKFSWVSVSAFALFLAATVLSVNFFLKPQQLKDNTNDVIKPATFAAKPKIIIIDMSHNPDVVNNQPGAPYTNAQAWLDNFKALLASADKHRAGMLLAALEKDAPSEFIFDLSILIRTLPYFDPVREALEKELLKRLIQLNPEAAAELVLKTIEDLPEFSVMSPKTYEMLNHLMIFWGKQNPDQAVNWALSLSDEQVKVKALMAMNYLNKPELISLVEKEALQMPEGYLRTGLLTHLATQIDPHQAVERIINWPDKERYDAIGSLIDYRASISLADTGTLVEELLERGMTLDSGATDRFIEHWYTQNPKEAYNWAYNLPESSIRDRTLQVLTEIRQNIH
jgi:hypothetical protein